MKKISIILLCLIAAALSVVACTKEPVPQSIEVSTMPKAQYYTDDTALDLSNGVITIKYNNGKTITVNLDDESVEVSGFVAAQTGTQIITVKHLGLETTFDITVSSIALSSFVVATAPTKAVYYTDDTALDLWGGVLKFNYNNGDIEQYNMMTGSNILTGLTFEPVDFSTAGEQNVVLRYAGHQTTFPITINAVEITGIVLSANPSRTEYYQGYTEKFDGSGGRITATRNSGRTETANLTSSSVSTSGFSTDELASTLPVTITYKGASTTFNVSVVADPVPAYTAKVGAILDENVSVDWDNYVLTISQTDLNSAREAFATFKDFSAVNKNRTMAISYKIISICLAGTYFAHQNNLLEAISAYQNGVQGSSAAEAMIEKINAANTALSTAADIYAFCAGYPIFGDKASEQATDQVFEQEINEVFKKFNDTASFFEVRLWALETAITLIEGLENVPPIKTIGDGILAYEVYIEAAYDYIAAYDGDFDDLIFVFELLQQWNPEYIDAVYHYYYMLADGEGKSLNEIPEIDVLLDMWTPSDFNKVLRAFNYALWGMSVYNSDETGFYFNALYLGLLDEVDNLMANGYEYSKRMYAELEIIVNGYTYTHETFIEEFLQELFFAYTMPKMDTEPLFDFYVEFLEFSLPYILSHSILGDNLFAPGNTDFDNGLRTLMTKLRELTPYEQSAFITVCSEGVFTFWYVAEYFTHYLSGAELDVAFAAFNSSLAYMEYRNGQGLPRFLTEMGACVADYNALGGASDDFAAHAGDTYLYCLELYNYWKEVPADVAHIDAFMDVAYAYYEIENVTKFLTTYLQIKFMIEDAAHPIDDYYYTQELFQGLTLQTWFADLTAIFNIYCAAIENDFGTDMASGFLSGYLEILRKWFYDIYFNPDADDTNNSATKVYKGGNATFNAEVSALIKAYVALERTEQTMFRLDFDIGEFTKIAKNYFNNVTDTNGANAAENVLFADLCLMLINYYGPIYENASAQAQTLFERYEELTGLIAAETDPAEIASLTAERDQVAEEWSNYSSLASSAMSALTSYINNYNTSETNFNYYYSALTSARAATLDEHLKDLYDYVFAAGTEA